MAYATAAATAPPALSFLEWAARYDVTSSGQVVARLGPGRGVDPPDVVPVVVSPRDFVADVLAAADLLLLAADEERARNPQADAPGVFGTRKVFLSAVLHVLRRLPAWEDLTRAEFGERVIAAHRARELVLARADLVQAMPADYVAASEVSYEGIATFHFVVRDPADRGRGASDLAEVLVADELVAEPPVPPAEPDAATTLPLAPEPPPGTKRTARARKRLSAARAERAAKPVTGLGDLGGDVNAAADYLVAHHGDDGTAVWGVPAVGDVKVFIRAILALLRRTSVWASLTREVFARRLVELNREGRVILANFDLKGAVAAAVLEESEVLDGKVTYHAVVRGTRRDPPATPDFERWVLADEDAAKGRATKATKATATKAKATKATATKATATKATATKAKATRRKR